MRLTMPAERLNELKVQHGRISRRRGRGVAARHCRGARAARRGSTQGMAQGADAPRMPR